MPRGSAVIKYDGKRQVVWRIKYRDASGKQVKETLGPESEGWTRRKAEAELRERLVRVERKGYRRPKPLTFAEYADTWFAEGETRRGWRPSTAVQYKSLKRRLVAYFGRMKLAEIRPRHLAEYVNETSRMFGPATVGRDVDLMHAIFKSAKREELVDSNPAEAVERPKIPKRRWRILEPAEVGLVARAFADPQARTFFLTAVITGLRLSELQSLRWADIDLIENVLRVRESKTEDGIRSIAISTRLAGELWQHQRRSGYQGDDERVFCHPERGTTYRMDKYKPARDAAFKAAGVDLEIDGVKMRPAHDLRHTALTNEAKSGSGSIALMTKAGHADMRTTKIYLDLAGVVFRDEAQALEDRLLGGTKLYPSGLTSDDLREPEPAEHAGSSLS